MNGSSPKQRLEGVHHSDKDVVVISLLVDGYGDEKRTNESVSRENTVHVKRLWRTSESRWWCHRVVLRDPYAFVSSVGGMVASERHGVGPTNRSPFDVRDRHNPVAESLSGNGVVERNLWTSAADSVVEVGSLVEIWT